MPLSKASYLTVLLAAVAWVVAACSQPAAVTLPLSGPGSQASAGLATSEYTLATGDNIRLVVFRNDDLTGEYSVDSGGQIALPLVGSVKVQGLTTGQAEAAVREKLNKGYLVDPQVSIQVLNYRPFFILGEVNNPGRYEYASGMTVLSAVAMAGGYTYRGRDDGVSLQRGGSNAAPVVVTPQTEILPGDIITVPERYF